MSCGAFKNPWLAERSQVTTRWGKKGPTFENGDTSMVFPLNSSVCVCVTECVCADSKLTACWRACLPTSNGALILSVVTLKVPVSWRRSRPQISDETTDAALADKLEKGKVELAASVPPNITRHPWAWPFSFVFIVEWYFAHLLRKKQTKLCYYVVCALVFVLIFALVLSSS